MTGFAASLTAVVVGHAVHPEGVDPANPHGAPVTAPADTDNPKESQ